MYEKDFIRKYKIYVDKKKEYSGNVLVSFVPIKTLIFITRKKKTKNFHFEFNGARKNYVNKQYCENNNSSVVVFIFLFF